MIEPAARPPKPVAARVVALRRSWLVTVPLLETALPARLGRPFRWLVLSSWVTNIGDGIAVAAGPLLIASQTRDPFLVALGAMLELPAGPAVRPARRRVADRVDRRLLVALSDGCRVVVIALLVTTIVTGEVNIAVVLVAIFLLGTGETFADTSAATLAPMLVARRDLGTRERPHHGRLRDRQPAGRPADRRVPLRSRARLAVRHPVRLRRPRGAAGAAGAPARLGGRGHRAARQHRRRDRRRACGGSWPTRPCARWC